MVAVVAGGAALLWPAALNGFPLVYWDTGGYIWSSVDHMVLQDRPIGYGLLIAATRALGFHTLWAVVAAQALGTALLLYRATLSVFPAQQRGRGVQVLCLLLLVSLSTEVARYASFAMPDIFSAWVVPGAWLLVAGRGRLDPALGAAAIVVSVMTHNTNGFLAVAFGASLIVLGRWLPRTGLRRSILPFGASLAAVAAVGLLNWSMGAGLTISRGGPTFLVNRLAATGVLSDTLDAYCPAAAWTLCDYRDLIRARQSAGDDWWYLWGDDSPLQRLGWEQGGGEQSEIVLRAFECCTERIVWSSIQSSRKQVQQMDPRQDLPRLEDSTSASVAIRSIYPGDVQAYAGSVQQSGQAPLVALFPEHDPAIFGLLAVFALLAASLCWRFGSRPLALVLLSTLFYVVLNAIVVGSLNGVDGRQQGRVAWLVPFWLFVGVLALLAERRIPAATPVTRATRTTWA